MVVDFFNKHDFSHIFVLIGILLIAISLPFVSYLVQKSQDNRSKASEAKTPKIAFKFSIEGIKPSYVDGDSSYDCFNQMAQLSFDFFNITANSSQLGITTTFSPVEGEVNSNGDQVFQTNEVTLDSKFNSVNDLNYLKVKWPFTLKSIMCLDNQDIQVLNDAVCSLNLFTNKVYDFSHHSLVIGDVNNDGLINGLDFSHIKVRFDSGANVSCGTEADLNLDGVVNGLDGTLVKKNLLLADDEELFKTSMASVSLAVTPTVPLTTIPEESINNEDDGPLAGDNEEEEEIEPTPTAVTVAPTIPTATPTQTQTIVYDPIVPKSFDDSDLSDSLKVWIDKNSGYYIVRLWAKDPYRQFHVYDASMHKKTYDTIASLFNHALSSNANGIKNKIAVAVNSDPSVYYGSYYYCRHSSDSSCPFNSYTSGGLIIREGKIYRNDTATNGKRNLTYTITKDNKMMVLLDKQTFSNAQSRVDAYKPAIDGGARNTASALHIMIDEGKKLSESNNPKKYPHLYKASSSAAAYRNALCQVNNNNFIYIVTNSSKTEKFLADKMLEFGCNIAVNNDGGGSTNFWFKKDTSSSWKHMVGSGSRGKMDSIVYWTEL